MWSKKGQSVYWFSVFTPGSTSLSSEVTALASVMTQTDRDRHTQSQVKGEGQRSFIHHPHHLWRVEQRLLLMSLVNSEGCLAGAQEAQIHIGSISPPKNKHITTLKHFPRSNPSSQLLNISPLKRMNSEGRFTQLIQGKLCICRQYGQLKGNNMSSDHSKEKFQAWHQVSS